MINKIKSKIAELPKDFKIGSKGNMENISLVKTHEVKKAVLIKTDDGIMIFGSCQSSSCEQWDADGCHRYCNSGISETSNNHKSLMLKSGATIIDPKVVVNSSWYKDRENFVDIEIPLNKEIFK